VSGEPRVLVAGPRVLVAGIGNIFFGDDGFGVAVASRLATMPARAGVTIADYGIRGVHLALDLLDGYDLLVLIDALPVGEEPGTVVLFEPEVPEEIGSTVDAHTMNPAAVLSALGRLGGSVERVLVVGCQPETVEERMGLSDVVAVAVEAAVVMVGEVLDDVFSTATSGGGRG
jgi:hydrogenase maturation protease